MSTVIFQYYRAHSRTKFEKVSDGLELRWPSGGFSSIDSDYIPQEGDAIVMSFGGPQDNPDEDLSGYGLKRGRRLGGVAWELIAL